MTRAPALLAFLLAGCSRYRPPAEAAGPAPGPVQAKPAQSSVFDHRQPDHARTPCRSCHVRDAGLTPRFPWHDACNACHSRETYLDPATVNPLCAVCHPPNRILDSSLSPRLKEFPAALNQFGLRRFSHRTHLQPAQHPENYGCGFCHRDSRAGAQKTWPAHQQCYACHIHEPDQKLARCEDCHALPPDTHTFARAGAAAARDYRFTHATHVKRSNGTRIACLECHAVSESSIVRMQPARGQQHRSTCWSIACHIRKDEPRCNKCHLDGVPQP